MAEEGVAMTTQADQHVHEWVYAPPSFLLGAPLGSTSRSCWCSRTDYWSFRYKAWLPEGR